MLICLFVKLERKRFNFAYDFCHLPLVYRQKYAGKLYTIKFYRAVEFYRPVKKFTTSLPAGKMIYRWFTGR